MARIGAIFTFAAALSACTSAPEPAATAPSPIDPTILHPTVLTLDTHVDIPLDFATDAVDPLDTDREVNLLKMQEGGLDVAFFIVYVAQTARTPENYAQAQSEALTKFAAIHRLTDELYPDRIGLAYRAADVERLVAEGKLVAAIGVENGFSLGRDLEMLDRYYALGARYVSLSHDGHNDLADSARPSTALGDVPAEHDGVSELGARLIRRLNELGIMVDISHASKQAALDTLALSAAPVIASHSSIRAVADHVRNLDDETLLALKANGGVVQIVAFNGYLKIQPPEQRAALDALAARLGLTPPVDRETLAESLRAPYAEGVAEIDAQWAPADVHDLVDHIDYAVKLIGIDHVGISSDFGGGGGIVGWADARETPNVTAALLARGYSEEAIRKLWGGNLLRVWREVERISEEL
ncbi:MAG TPA: dipeptidase [Gammaproteobacteria bacterium]